MRVTTALCLREAVRDVTQFCSVASVLVNLLAAVCSRCHCCPTPSPSSRPVVCRSVVQGASKVEPRVAKQMYAAFIAFAALFALCMNQWGDKIESAHRFVVFKAGCGKESFSQCFGTQATFRISFAVAVFFAFMLVASISEVCWVLGAGGDGWW